MKWRPSSPAALESLAEPNLRRLPPLLPGFPLLLVTFLTSARAIDTTHQFPLDQATPAFWTMVMRHARCG
jgi:hypothetical protein